MYLEYFLDRLEKLLPHISAMSEIINAVAAQQCGHDDLVPVILPFKRQ